MAGVARELAELGERVFGTSDVAAVLERMRTDPALRWNSEDELIDAAREAVTRAEEAAPRWFGRVPEQRCQVEPVPAADAPGAPTAYYAPPSPDGLRPGTYYANTHRVEERFRYQAEVIAFHEAVPGHHFQITLAQQLTDLPMLRRIAGVTAYLEGWGLYTSDWPTRWVCTRTTWRGSGCWRWTRCAPGGWSWTPDCTRTAGAGRRAWST